jgi:hypothetical protein
MHCTHCTPTHGTHCIALTVLTVLHSQYSLFSVLTVQQTHCTHFTHCPHYFAHCTHCTHGTHCPHCTLHVTPHAVDTTLYVDLPVLTAVLTSLYSLDSLYTLCATFEFEAVQGDHKSGIDFMMCRIKGIGYIPASGKALNNKVITSAEDWLFAAK